MTNLRQHDVNEAELTDVEELLERDQELAALEDAKATASRPHPTSTAHHASSSHMPAHPASHEDDTPYDGDVEQGVLGSRRRQNQPRRRRRRREMMERGLQELGEQELSQLGTAEEGSQLDTEQEEPQQSRQPAQRPLGWFFDEATRDERDPYGINDGLTLAQRVYNLPPGRRFL